MPEGVYIKKYITPEEYLIHLVDVVADAKTNHMNTGGNAYSPTRGHGYDVKCCWVQFHKMDRTGER